jgi:hypothetical protein
MIANTSNMAFSNQESHEIPSFDMIQQHFDIINYNTLNYDYTNLLDSLSAQYCLCDLVDPMFNSQPAYSSLVDLTCMLGEDKTPMQSAQINLSTLKIPKASYKSSITDDMPTPHTLSESPVTQMKYENSFSQCSKETAAQLQILGSAFVGV